MACSRSLTAATGRAPVYIDDLVEGIVVALRRGRPGSSYTLWDGEPVSFSEYFTRLAELTGGKPPRNLPRPVLSAVAGATELAARLRGRAPAFGRHGVTLVDRRGTASNHRAREELRLGAAGEPRRGHPPRRASLGSAWSPPRRLRREKGDLDGTA